MKTMNILDYMQEHLLYLDGGMGTLLQEAGLAPGEYPERWNLSHPDVIQKIQKDYFEAGSNVVATNTFGANALKFSQEELSEIIAAAVQNTRIARDSADAPQAKYIALGRRSLRQAAQAVRRPRFRGRCDPVRRGRTPRRGKRG